MNFFVEFWMRNVDLLMKDKLQKLFTNKSYKRKRVPAGLEHPIWMPFRNQNTVPNSTDVFKKEQNSRAGLCGATHYKTWQKAGIASES